MMIKIAAVATAAVFAVTGVSAKTIDFTTTGDGGVAASGSTTSGVWDGVGVTFNALPDGNYLTHATNGFNDQPGDQAECLAQGLACVVDGIGINDDEVSEPFGSETLELVFDVIQNVTGIHLLDLYVGDSAERARVRFFDAEGTEIAGVDVNADGNGPDAGYRFRAVDVEGVLSIKFDASRGPICDEVGCRDDGNNDFALAAVDVSAVPLPAGGLLILTGMGALAVARRKKRAA